ncbi:NAD(P)H-binding protein [Streptomyces sp. LX-29]|uniref:SDR family oxidoreductase n=1 Tax=Streptomyces sp. LX-29 TaxID=2900152 RepID=UPI00240E2D58|nr:NAD(P)H-binding protein [Streptomyces sp. LX-29]WFB11268.1 NAD(P)H-binding protein [Streptomyces sp. LX-29]
MILVTGATGNVGGVLLDELHASGVGPLRALTRDVTQARFPEGVEAMKGDLADPTSWKPAFEGVRSLFLVPHLGPDAEILQAARHAGVEHVVLLSSITVQTHPHLGPAQGNREVERLLKESGMAWTVLRPTQFASNTLMWATAVREGEAIHAPYGDVALPTIHPADIAAVARVALTEPDHQGRTYALTGPERVTPRQQVAAIASALGRALDFSEISREQAHARMVAVFGAEAADAVLDVTGGDVNDELSTVRDTVSRVTGASARPFRQWASENVAAFR